MKTTMKEREILAAIKRQVKYNRGTRQIMLKTLNEYDTKFPVKHSSIGINNTLYPEGHPLCLINLEADRCGSVYYTAYTDAGFDMLPQAMKEFVFEYELEYANTKTNTRYIKSLEEVDSVLVEKYGKEYVLRRLKWLHKYCGHILHKDKLAERIENIEFNTI